MNKSRIILVVCFLAAFAAGVVAGVAWARRGRPDAPRRPWIEEELDLTAEQREKMREIWSESMSTLRVYQRDRRQSLLAERDDAIQNLLSVQQKAEYDDILKTYARKSEELDDAGKEAFEEATRRTKEILTDKQLEAYEKMLRERAGRHRHGSRGNKADERGSGETPHDSGEEPPGPPPPPLF